MGKLPELTKSSYPEKPGLTLGSVAVALVPDPMTQVRDILGPAFVSPLEAIPSGCLPWGLSVWVGSCQQVHSGQQGRDQK